MKSYTVVCAGMSNVYELVVTRGSVLVVIEKMADMVGVGATVVVGIIIEVRSTGFCSVVLDGVVVVGDFFSKIFLGAGLMVEVLLGVVVTF